MKQNRTFLNWLLLLMMTVGMTSCQGLIDAIFGEADYPAEIPVQPSKPTKQSAIISYATASIGKTFGDAAFTNALTNTGDGKVTYATSNTAVATVNSETGEVGRGLQRHVRRHGSRHHRDSPRGRYREIRHG